MVIATGISTMIFAVGALSYQTITANQRVSVTYGSVTIGGAAAENFYGKPAGVTEIDAYFAPNYGRASTADLMRDVFYDDLARSSAVYCLGREGLSPARPSQVIIPVGDDGKRVDTPNAFLTALEASEPLLSGIHTAYTGASTARNLSIYMMLPARSNRPNRQLVRAIWEIDVLNITTEPRGTYTTVRRYSGSYLTDVCDVFFPENLGATFKPLAVNFEREVRVISGSPAFNDGFDKIRIAKEEPFYFVWWPDPAAANIDGDNYKTNPDSDPNKITRDSYWQMGGRTSYMFTFPMFPAL